MSDLIKTRKGIFIPDITVEMFRNASLEAVEELLVSGEMQDIILPSAEPERKTAEWIYGENGGQDGWYCSKCGLFIPWDYEYYGLDNIDFIADFHTCPKCDRKMLKYTGMRGEQE